MSMDKVYYNYKNLKDSLVLKMYILKTLNNHIHSTKQITVQTN